ncbi:MAG: DUF1540 domain-containing protein [Clostridia bacterium]|nr:DUF1540 domain-containing protein [Clostridia bacterium]
MNYKDCDCGCKKTNSHKHLSGIGCDVKNCVHHDGDHYCCADKINVGPSFATSCTDTVCATFKQKES